MGLNATLAGALALVLLGACESDADREPARPAPRPAAEPVEPPAPRGPYDAEGRLRESGERVAGLPLPVGLEPVELRDRGRHAYRSQGIPLDKVVQFFGPRLFTGQIDRVGAGVVYREAVPMRDRGARQTMDVSISPVGPQQVLVTIDEHALPPLVAPDVADLEKTLREEQKRIE